MLDVDLSAPFKHHALAAGGNILETTSAALPPTGKENMLFIGERLIWSGEAGEES